MGNYRTELYGQYNNYVNHQKSLNPSHHAKIILSIGIKGRELTILHNSTAIPGDHVIDWKTAQSATGTYLLRAKSGDYAVEQKLVLVK